MGSPLEKKLGLKNGLTVLFDHEPSHYRMLFEVFPEDLHHLEDLQPESADFIHTFCTTEAELEETANELIPLIKKTGMIWISWPKQSSSIRTELKSNLVRTRILKTGLVDCKVAAIDDDWSALKFVHRLKNR